MKLSIKNIAELILILIILILFIVLIIPFDSIVTAGIIPAGKTPSANDENKVVEKKIETRKSQDIAKFFGYVYAPKVIPVIIPGNNTVKVEQGPVNSPWISYISRSVIDKKQYYWFKNTQTNEFFGLTMGKINNGWKLLSVKDGKFILKNNGKKYIVMEH